VTVTMSGPCSTDGAPNAGSVLKLSEATVPGVASGLTESVTGVDTEPVVWLTVSQVGTFVTTHDTPFVEAGLYALS
jgi:hypothetical protein